MPPKRTAATVVRSQLVPLALGYLAARGIDLSSRLGDARIDERGVSLELVALHALLDACAEAGSEPWLGLALARARPLGSHGIVEFFWRSCATLREGLATLAAHSRLLNELSRLELGEAGREASFLQRVDAHPLGMGRHANEFFCATLVREMRRLVAPSFKPIRVRLAHPRPAHNLAPLHRALGTDELVWEDAATGLDFDPRWLDAPLLTADPSLATALRAHSRGWLPWVANDAAQSLDSRLGALLRSSIGRPLTLQTAARRLGVAARTLQRRLSERGKTFQSVTDEVLAEHACRLVESGSVTVKEASRRLGYTSMAAFVRAFRRWTGATPTRWRHRRRDWRDR